MMIRKLNKDTGDIETSGTQFIYDLDAVAQNITTNLRLFYGEYYRNVEIGVDWYNNVFLKGSMSRNNNSEIRRNVTEYEEVQAITSYSADFDKNTRNAKIKMTIMTTFGDVDLNFEETINENN